MLAKLCCLSTDSCKGQCIGLSRNQNIKLTYIIIFLIILISSQIVNSLSNQQQINYDDVEKYDCTQIDQKYRQNCISQKKTSLDLLALTIFHSVLFLYLLPKTKHVKVINQGMWLIKIIILVGLVFLIRFTFGPSISQYVQVGQTLLTSVLFMLTNFIIVDNIYFLDFKLNTLAEKYKKLHVIKVVLSLVIWALSIVLNVFSYYQNQLWVSISCTVAICAFLVLTFLRMSRNNTLFVYALIMIHMNFISYSIHSQQETQNNRNFNGLEHGYRIFILIISLFGMLAEGGNQIRTKKSTINQLLALNTSKKQEDNRYVSSNKWIMYHLVMIIIAYSAACVFTYEYQATTGMSKHFLDIGRITWWVSLILIYLWSIIVQKIYPQQDFSELENYFKEFQLN